MLFKLSNLNSNLALTLVYPNPALNNSALDLICGYIYAFLDELILNNYDMNYYGD